jgi:hypothetical protein
MYRQTQLPPPNERILVDVRSPGEWAGGTAADGRALHVHKLGGDDWLVSEVGRDPEDRGPDLTRALAERCVRAVTDKVGNRWRT